MIATEFADIATGLHAHRKNLAESRNPIGHNAICHGIFAAAQETSAQNGNGDNRPIAQQSQGGPSLNIDHVCIPPLVGGYSQKAPTIAGGSGATA
ncbi:MAG: hypothetical protein JJU36_02750 [Phycisphaeraceae bacterium]|nr:hypothetical protein [Phycisphaeraceae bacterium]